MAQSERCVRSLPELLIEENQRREVEAKPPKQVHMVVIGGTNGSGKSSIVDGLSELLTAAYYRTDLRWGVNPQRDEQMTTISGWNINFFANHHQNSQSVIVLLLSGFLAMSQSLTVL